MFRVEHCKLRRKRTGKLCLESWNGSRNVETSLDVEHLIGKFVVAATEKEGKTTRLHNIVEQKALYLDDGTWLSNWINPTTGQVEVHFESENSSVEVTALLKNLTEAIKEIGPNGL